MEILRVENICKTYEMDNAPVHALSDVSFSVDKGEFVAIIGASGSGKSTLLHILGGVDRPTSGKVFVDSSSFKRSLLILRPSNRIGSVIFSSTVKTGIRL